MSDDTATVDVVQRLREYHAGETKYIATLADAVDEIEDNRALIEQQARTIAELREQLQAEKVISTMWQTGAEGLQRKVDSLKTQWANSVSKANTTIAEQAARLGEAEELIRDLKHRLETHVWTRSGTHWAGCEKNHNDCALTVRADAYLAAIDGAKT